MVIISIGMPRSGTLWRYNLVRDLVKASGGKDGLDIRRRYMLHMFLGKNNADINTLRPHRLIPVLVPSILGNTFTINTHAGPTPFAIRLLNNGKAGVIYGYRDPRACLLSILDYSKRAYPGYSAKFLNINSIEQAVEYFQRYLRIWDGWMAHKNVLKIRYEAMLVDYEGEVEMIVEYVGAEKDSPEVKEVIRNYLPGHLREGGLRMHLEYGKADRFRKEFSPEELAYLNEHLAPYLEKMGYPP